MGPGLFLSEQYAPPMDTVTTIDCQYQGPRQAASYLIVEGGRAAFVDNNTVHAVPHLLAALAAQGLAPAQVEYAIITHVHLDHAGGTAALLEACPNATVLAHPKAARHIIDPGRLVAGAKAVYGEAEFRRLYGEIGGVDAGRVRVMEDGEELSWGARRLRFFYTLGHAKHHFCVHDTKTNAVFTGDAFGIGRGAEVRGGPPFLACICTPPDFDAAQTKASLDLILATGATRVFIGHYGSFNRLEEGAAQIRASVDQMAAISEEAAASGVAGEDLEAFCAARVSEAMDEHLRRCGVADFEGDRHWLERHAGLNAIGLAYAAQQRRNMANA